MIKYMDLIVLKDYLKNGEMVMIKEHSIEMVIYQELIIMLS